MNAPAPPDVHQRPRWLIVAVTVVGLVLLHQFQFGLFRAVAGDWPEGFGRLAARAVLGYALPILAVLALAAALFGPPRAWSALGLDRSILTGLGVGLLGTSILLVGFLATAKFAPPDRLLYVALRGSVLPGVAEEILFRAFVFGFLFRFARCGFLPAALVGAVVFGAGHLYQGNGLAESAAVFAITALGALWFSWLYVEWGFNIWVPAAFHVLMNLYWELFAISDTALGSVSANVLRLAVIVLSIVLTVIAARRRGGRTVRGKAWFWPGASGGPEGLPPRERMD